MTLKSALVIGASRGMGRQIALAFGANGFLVGVAAKTTLDTTKTPGTIYSVVEEIQKRGGNAIPIQCDVREEAQLHSAIHQLLETCGHIDAIIYNAGAIMWKPVIETSTKRFDLMHSINLRGVYIAVHSILPHFIQRNYGRIILVSPPIYNRFFKGKTPYAITKVGATVLTMGLANELKDTGITISSLWPATVTESQVTVTNGVDEGLIRKSTLFADACLEIVNEPSPKYNGQALIDEDLMRSIGVTDFSKYRLDPNVEPPRMMPKKFPSLLVEEENESMSWQNNSSKL